MIEAVEEVDRDKIDGEEVGGEAGAKEERKNDRPDHVPPPRSLRTREREKEREACGHGMGKTNNRKSISAYLIGVDGGGSLRQILIKLLVSVSDVHPRQPRQPPSLATPATRHLDESKNNKLFAIVKMRKSKGRGGLLAYLV